LYEEPLSAPARSLPTAAAAAPQTPARPAPGTLLLDVQHLAVRYPVRSGVLQRVRGGFDAVRDVSLRIHSGRTLALVGESGCGKTTVGKAIVQLLRRQAQVSGRALLDGSNLFDLQGDALRDARREIQIVFQDPFASLDPRMRVGDILEEGLITLRPDMDALQRRERIAGLLDRVGLRADSLQRHPHEFSGGQRQRIAIARALAVRPRLIVCDEATSALDVSVQAQILNLLRELQAESGVAYLFVTHNIGVVAYLADEVAVMQGGQLVEQGTTDQVLGHPQHAYTRELLAAVPVVSASAR
jgi:peptide/nickel transport system ATP-binding protein